MERRQGYRAGLQRAEATSVKVQILSEYDCIFSRKKCERDPPYSVIPWGHDCGVPALIVRFLKISFWSKSARQYGKLAVVTGLYFCVVLDVCIVL